MPRLRYRFRHVVHTDGFHRLTVQRSVTATRGVVFEEGASLPEGTPVRITVESGRGSPQAVLEAMGQPPHVSEEDVAELVKELERGKRPIQFDSPLD